DYRDSKILWVPYHELHCAVESKPASATSPKVNTTEKKLKLPILGTKEAIVIRKSKKLEGHVYYLIAGHGGPDPGAVGSRGQNTLCEDEYAYDVTLRLYKLLIEQGAQAYMIIQDKNDGIRDDAILTCDRDETCHGAKIPLNQTKRLKQRVAHVNQLFYHHQKKGIKAQTCLSIHVDSRSRNHRQDVFFCHYPSSQSSKKLATQLQKTFAKKYGVHRQGGHYAGCVSERGNLYVLKNTLPKAVLVELANIQNKSDHRRIIQPSNRQALANWMLEGLLAST
ncbi:MAG: N-acetylmuramoyl-L-alanine amidase, partial [Saprospiraceae bacterium]|nr:N-acetylmuramoyl-L-alanine amidase [Saprospiraceae bacterium]